MAPRRKWRQPDTVAYGEWFEAAEGKTLKGTMKALGINFSTGQAYLNKPENAELGKQVYEITSKTVAIPKTVLAGRIGGVAPKGEEVRKITRESGKTGDTVELNGPRITTLDQLLAAADVDLETWYVDRQQINKYETFSAAEGVTPLFQVKAWLERDEKARDLTTLRDEVVEEMKRHTPPPVRRYKATPKTGLCQDILIPDLHLGKLAHAEETGQNYDGAIAVRAFRHVLYQLLTHAQNMSVDRLIFPAGNDLLHVDGGENETTNGTRQDTDSRYHRSRRRARKLMVEAIQAMAQVAPVDVVIVPGNHARMAEEWLGEVLYGWFHNDERVTIHDSAAPRKYLQHGTTLLGFTHGDGVAAKDLPLLMATEAPLMWAETEHRFWNTGHLHQRKASRFGSIIEDKGVEVRISPSLSATDAWHAGKGYVGNLRAAESHVYSETDGEIARFRAVLPRDHENVA